MRLKQYLFTKLSKSHGHAHCKTEAATLLTTHQQPQHTHKQSGTAAQGSKVEHTSTAEYSTARQHDWQATSQTVFYSETLLPLGW